VGVASEIAAHCSLSEKLELFGEGIFRISISKMKSSAVLVRGRCYIIGYHFTDLLLQMQLFFQELM